MSELPALSASANLPVEYLPVESQLEQRAAAIVTELNAESALSLR